MTNYLLSQVQTSDVQGFHVRLFGLQVHDTSCCIEQLRSMDNNPKPAIEKLTLRGTDFENIDQLTMNLIVID